MEDTTKYRIIKICIGIMILTGCIGFLVWDDIGGVSSGNDASAVPGHPPEGNKSVSAGTCVDGTGNRSLPLACFLQTDFPPADGFDYPVGNENGQGSYVDPETGVEHHGWYVATRFLEKYALGIHPGEDWNGRGGGNSDLGQAVHATANGKVSFAGSCGKLWGNVIVVQHLYYENHKRKTISSVYVHLEKVHVKKGDIVQRRQKIGTIGRDPDGQYYAHLHFELRHNTRIDPSFWPSAEGKSMDWIRRNYAAPSAFIGAHRNLFVPQDEPTLILVDQDRYTMHLYQKGNMVGQFDVSFGQSKGRKRRQGDNKTPKGIYFVIDHHRGHFGGDYGAYYGGHWIKINYPNRYDAAWGRSQNLISADLEKEISHKWSHRRKTVENTPLGGGIGFHGWIREWDNGGPRHLSWGCIVLHNRDIAGIYDKIPPGTMVIIR